MSWKKESVLVLVKATPNWSKKQGRYVICTAGIAEDGGWRRLYPMSQDTIQKHQISVWDKIQVETTDPIGDARPESRKLRNDSVRNMGCAIEDREERRNYLQKITDASLEKPMKEKRTMALVKPLILGFDIEKREEPLDQATLYGGVFERRPYADVGLYYRFKCSEKGCEVCQPVGKFHRMECFDWGAHVLYRKYDDETVAKEKTRDMCFTKMRFDFDTWFALGTHSRYPSWMVVGLLWMSKQPKEALSQ